MLVVEEMVLIFLIKGWDVVGVVVGVMYVRMVRRIVMRLLWGVR